ncbi:hypothetical protein EV356DRAFT_513513 [Viridothelium virens]|uniref:Uncharacterized protein n=1 Tax=Viridothelium virens TaxID=1048519 RepID=A0A6A6HEQ4_VIRVR|nr:hypothetical protein EV356DRAFT_513513 [Viridothelium virens]
MADQSELQIFWQDAIKAYKSEAEHSAATWNRSVPLNTPEDLANLIERQGQSFKDFRNKHRKVWSCLKRTLDPITTLGDIISVILGAVPVSVPATVILGSVLHLVSTCQDVANAYDWIQTVFAELDEFARRLQSYTSTGRSDTTNGTKGEIPDVLRRKIIAILAFILRVIGRSERLIRRNRFREYLRVTFIGKDEKTKALVEDLNQLLANEQRLVVALTYEKTEEVAALAGNAVNIGAETQGVVNDMHETVNRLADAVEDQAIKRLNEQQITNLRAVLNTTAVDETNDWYSLLKKSLLQGSGAWLQREPFFDYWLQHQAPSMLSAWLSKSLLEKSQSSADDISGASIGYFFIEENKDSSRNLNIILQTLAWQILETDTAFRSHAVLACELSRNTARAEDTWENLFLNYYQPRNEVKECRRAILILDGLDEADQGTRQRLLEMMKAYISRIRSNQPHRIQFAVFGRTTLRSDLKKLRFDNVEKAIEVSSKKNEEDIKNYIEFRLKKLSVIQAMRTKKGANSADKAKKFAHGIRKKRDLKFGEIDVILRIDSPTTNWLLWDHLRDKFSSILRFRYPCGYDPDAVAPIPATNNVDADETAQSEKMAVEEDHDDAVGSNATADIADNDDDFDLGDDSDEDADQASSGDDDDDKDSKEDDNDDEDSKTQTESKAADETQEADYHYEWNQRQTEIDFTHQRFREYLRIEGDQKTRKKKDLPINLDIHKVQLELTLDCFKMLRLGSQRDFAPIHYFSYPAFYIFDHLDQIDIACVGQHAGYSTDTISMHQTSSTRDHDTDRECDDVKRKMTTVCSELFWLLHEEEGCRAIINSLDARTDGEPDMFWQLWLGHQRKTPVMQRWLDIASKDTTLDQEQRDWCVKAAKSVTELLNPLAMTMTKIWLTKKGYDDVAYTDKSEFLVWFLKGYRSLGDNADLPEKLANFNYSRDLSFYGLAASAIEDLAECAGLEKTSHWYTGLGWILYEARETDRAIEILGKAIELDHQAWVPMEATARAYAEAKRDYETAIEWMNKALEVMPKYFKDTNVDSYILQNVAGWKQQLGDYSGAFQIAKDAWYANAASMPCAHRYIMACIDAECWWEIIDVLGYLDTWNTGNDKGGSTYLIQFMSNYLLPWRIGWAVRDQKQPVFLLDAMDDTLAVISQTNHDALLIHHLFHYGKFSYTFYDKDDRPIGLYEEALTRLKSSDTSTQDEFSEHKVTFTNKLALLYFDLAVQEHKAGRDPAEHANKLKRLATIAGFTVGSEEQSFFLYTPGYPSLLWGRWLRDYEKADTRTWRKCFRSRLLEQIKGLDDDDPTNDTRAYINLASSLFQAGDRVNAGAIVAVMFKTLEEYIKQRGSVQAAAANEDQMNEDSPETESLQTAGSDRPPNTQYTTQLKDEAEKAEGEERGTDDHLPQAAGPEPPPALSHRILLSRADGTPVEALAEKIAPSTGEAPLSGIPFPRAIPTQKPRERAKLTLHLESDIWEYTCDLCGYDAEDKGSMYFCEICLDTSFCGECLTKIKARSSNVRMCNPDHEWYQVWPLNQDKVREMAEDLGMERDDGEIVLELKREWLEALREKWLIE